MEKKETKETKENKPFYRFFIKIRGFRRNLQKKYIIGYFPTLKDLREESISYRFRNGWVSMGLVFIRLSYRDYKESFKYHRTPIKKDDAFTYHQKQNDRD